MRRTAGNQQPYWRTLAQRQPVLPTVWRDKLDILKRRSEQPPVRKNLSSYVCL